MKNTIIILFSILLTGIGFYGCKKGPNDPFLSIHSRKARVAGEWKLTAGTELTIINGVSENRTDDGVHQLYVDTSNTSYADDHTVTYTMDKKGGYTGTEHRLHKEVDIDTLIDWTTTTTTTTDDKYVGTWNFTDKIGELKNKSQLTMIETSDTWTESVRTVVVDNSSSPSVTVSDSTKLYTGVITNTGNPGAAELWDLDELRNKKMVVLVKGSGISSSNASPATTYSHDAKWTFEQD